MSAPYENPGLVRDCEVLLQIRDTLANDVTLYWSVFIPIRKWKGIGLDGRPGRVVDLALPFMGLTGVIPPELAQLDALEYIDLTDNRLSGTVPPELGQLRKLKRINLGVNRLSGPLPLELGNLSMLESMVLGQNQLSGVIPSELGNLANLRELNFGTNFLTGEVPKELARLTKLETIHIDTNRLTGCVPDELRVADHRIGRLKFCSDIKPLWDQEPVFEGGVDLGVAFIERLPRYLKHRVAYSLPSPDCPYPFDEFIGLIDCERGQDVKRWPDPGENVELIAHLKNYGDAPSGPFKWTWNIDGQQVLADISEGLLPGERVEIKLETAWPSNEDNPLVEFTVDSDNDVQELIEDNNSVTDWIKGYTLGIYFNQGAYDSLIFSNEPGRTIQSPEHWIHKNAARLNDLFIQAGLDERIRVEQLFITDGRPASTDLWDYLDGWWPIWDDVDIYTVEGYQNRPEIDYGLLHEWLHQLGVIDLYLIHIGPADVGVPDVNRPGEKAGCGPPYWNHYLECFRFTIEGRGLMTDLHIHKISDHTAGALAANGKFRRGYYGEYLYDTPTSTSIRVVDRDDNPIRNVTMRFFQMAPGGPYGAFIDDIPEFSVITDDSGRAILPNRGIKGVTTATGHLLRLNPFGLIDVVGFNSIFIIEMTSDECTNYEWLTIVELNLAYWDGHTDHAEFTKTLRCPPP